MRYVAMIGVFGGLGAAMGMGAQLAGFVDMPSLLLVLIGAVLVPLCFHTPREVKEALAAGFSTASVAPEKGRIHRAVLGTIRSGVVGSGVMGILIGFVSMLSNMEDPSKLGPAMAVALLTPLYSVFLSELWLAPMSHRLLVLEETNSTGSGQGPASPSVLLNIASVSAVLVSFGVLAMVLDG